MEVALVGAAFICVYAAVGGYCNRPETSGFESSRAGCCRSVSLGVGTLNRPVGPVGSVAVGVGTCPGVLGGDAVELKRRREGRWCP